MSGTSHPVALCRELELRGALQQVRENAWTDGKGPICLDRPTFEQFVVRFTHGPCKQCDEFECSCGKEEWS